MPRRDALRICARRFNDRCRRRKSVCGNGFDFIFSDKVHHIVNDADAAVQHPIVKISRRRRQSDGAFPYGVGNAQTQKSRVLKSRYMQTGTDIPTFRLNFGRYRVLYAFNISNRLAVNDAADDKINFVIFAVVRRNRFNAFNKAVELQQRPRLNLLLRFNRQGGNFPVRPQTINNAVRCFLVGHRDNRAFQ